MDGGPAAQAQLDEPLSVAVDGASNIYDAEGRSHRIRQPTPSGLGTALEVAIPARGGVAFASKGTSPGLLVGYARAEPRDRMPDLTSVEIVHVLGSQSFPRGCLLAATFHVRVRKCEASLNRGV